MSTEKKEPKRHGQLQIQLDEETAQGLYANLTMVNHTETEFILDFIYLQPQQPRAKVRSRVVSSPKHTKRLMMALKENIEKYEKKFGVVDISAADRKKKGSFGRESGVVVEPGVGRLGHVKRKLS